jgi:L-fuconolactonase
VSEVVDAHHHLWDPTGRDYPWMTGSAAVLRRPETVDDLRRETSSAGVSRTVLVQTVAELAETEEFLVTSAGSDGLIAGVVGWADLRSPDVGDTLDRLRAGPGGDRLVGIRHQVHDEPDPDWLDQPCVLRGLGALAERGLCFDLLVRSRELPSALRVARARPQVSFVVDHAAKPAIAQREVEPWASRLAELAGLDNVTCKLSGLVTEAPSGSWTVADLAPYTARLLEWFGPGRLMFGSDWPVCTLAADYAGVLDTARTLLAGLSPAETASVFSNTASRVYHL